MKYGQWDIGLWSTIDDISDNCLNRLPSFKTWLAFVQPRPRRTSHYGAGLWIAGPDERVHAKSERPNPFGLLIYE